MANVSDADGKMFFFTRTKSELKTLTEILDVTSKWYYNIYAWSDISEPTEISEISLFHNELMNSRGEIFQVEAEVSIGGNGRWDFYSNMEHLGEWLDSDRERGGLPPMLKEKLEKMTFAIGFDVNDIESSCDYLAAGKVLLYHKAGTPVSEMPIIFENYRGYDFTRENIKKIRDLDDETFDEAYGECFDEEEDDGKEE